MLGINWSSLIYACLSDVANVACSHTVVYLVKLICDCIYIHWKSFFYDCKFIVYDQDSYDQDSQAVPFSIIIIII